MIVSPAYAFGIPPVAEQFNHCMNDTCKGVVCPGGAFVHDSANDTMTLPQTVIFCICSLCCILTIMYSVLCLNMLRLIILTLS